MQYNSHNNCQFTTIQSPAVHGAMGCDQINLKLAWKTPENLSWRPSDEGTVRPVIASNGVPYLQMRSEGTHSTSGSEKEGKRKGRTMQSYTVHSIWLIAVHALPTLNDYATSNKPYLKKVGNFQLFEK